MEFKINIKIYLIVPKFFSKEIASFVHTIKPSIIFIKLVVINDVVIKRHN